MPGTKDFPNVDTINVVELQYLKHLAEVYVNGAAL